jgi:hypothetical protein
MCTATSRPALTDGFHVLGITRRGSAIPPDCRIPAFRAVFAVPDSAAAYYPWYHTVDSTGRRDASNYFRALAPWMRADIDQYRRDAPSSHGAEIHDASHWVFLSHRDETLSAMRAFFATLGP